MPIDFTENDVKKCVHGEVTGTNGRNDNDAALETLKATTNSVQEEQMELEEKIKMLKEEFSSLPRVLIKKTLCDDAVDGHVTKAKQRLMEFKHQLKDREHCFKNPGGVGRDAGKLNRDLDGSAVFRPTKMANADFEEQTLPDRGNTMRQKNETVEELHVGSLRTQSDVFMFVA